MAGMLPGVEVARRRRLRQSGGAGWLDSHCASSSGNGSTSRSPFCLYPSSHESRLSTISTMQRSPIDQADCDPKLGDAAREAKKRLDCRLRAQWESETKRCLSSRQRSRQLDTRPVVQREMQTEVSKLKKTGSKRFSLPKFLWKSSEQDECAVCLEQLMAGENLMQLPCAHRFHSKCLVPWLENNVQCPCCRMELVQNYT